MSIKFYSTNGEYGCFSNFSRHPIKYKGQTYSTSEHAFQAAKFVGTALESKVRKAKGPSEAARIGRDRSNPLRKDWESVKDNIMREIIYSKFSQDKHLKETLLSTGDQEVIEHTENDSYWGDGGNGKGRNMLGRILMEVREILKNE